MKKYFILISLMFYNLSFTSAISFTLFSNFYFHPIYLTNPNTSFGMGLSIPISKKIELGTSISFMRMGLHEEGYGIGINGKYIHYDDTYKQLYFLPQIDLRYVLLENKKFTLSANLGDQFMFIYYNYIELITNGESFTKEEKKISMYNNSIFISVLLNYKFTDKIGLEIQPFYMKNIKNFSLDQTNYRFQVGVIIIP